MNKLQMNIIKCFSIEINLKQINLQISSKTLFNIVYHRHSALAHSKRKVRKEYKKTKHERQFLNIVIQLIFKDLC